MVVVAEFRDRAAGVEVDLLNLQFAGDEAEAEGEEGLCAGTSIQRQLLIHGRKPHHISVKGMEGTGRRRRN